MANNKKLDAISAFLEGQSTPESEFVPMGEVDWDFVRPLLEEVVLATYERDAVPVIEEIDARVNRGKGAAPEPPASPAENGHAALPEGESALEVVTPA